MKASVIDYVKEDLDPDVWAVEGESLHLQADIRDEILDVVASFLADTDVGEDALAGVFIYGSILTNQYNQNTDIDCRIKLKEKEAHEVFPDLSGEDIFDMNRDILHGVTLEGTTHPLNCSVAVGEESPLGETKFDPVFDVLANEVVVDPVKEKEDFDPDKEFAKEKEEAIDVMSKLDELLQKAKIDTVDFLWLDEAKLTAADKEQIVGKLNVKLEEVKADLDEIVDAYHALKESRSKAFEDDNDAESHHQNRTNVVFKLTEKYDYIQILRDLKHKLEQEGVDSSEDVEDVAEILDVGE